MTISAKNSAVAFLHHDRVNHLEYPHIFPVGDPGAGSGAGSTIVVQLADNSYTYGWDSQWAAATLYPFPPGWTANQYRQPTINPSAFNHVRPSGAYTVGGPTFKLDTSHNGYGTTVEPDWASAVNIGDTVTEQAQGGGTPFTWRRITPLNLPAQPSNAQLVAAKRWWPLGFHHWGQVTWSRNYGIVVSSRMGLTPEGLVTQCNFCYPYTVYGPRKWIFLGPSSIVGQNYSQYYSNTHAWYKHLGYDLRLRQDIVVREDNRTGQWLSVYALTPGPNFPATVQQKIWQGTDGDRAAGVRFGYEGAGGCLAVQIPWLSQWWVVQFKDDGSENKLWGFSPQTGTNWTIGNNGLGGGISTRNSFDITVPSQVQALCATSGRNISICVDQFNKRVFAFQVDTNAAPQLVKNENKYPVLCWQINPSTPTAPWTAVQLSTVSGVLRAGKTTFSAGGVLNPVAWFGGSRFMLHDAVEAGTNATYGAFLNADPAHATGNPPRSNIPATAGAWGGSGYPFENQRTGGFAIAEICIPTASQPRYLTCTARDTVIPSGWGPDWHAFKHTAVTHGSAADGRVYLFGGDVSGVPGSPGSYSTALFSLTPEIGTDLRLDSPNGNPQASYPSAQGPIGVDENHIDYRPASNDLWHFTGYGPGHISWPQCGWPTIEAWHAAGGTSEGIYRYNFTTGWTHPIYPPFNSSSTPSNCYDNPDGIPIDGVLFRWCQGEPSCKRMYLDVGTDRMIGQAYGDNTIQMVNIFPDVSGSNVGKYMITKYLACVECWNGAYGVGFGGNGQKLPDGRPITDTQMGSTGMAGLDRGCLDPDTGWFYTANAMTGDIFRINTRTGFYNRAADNRRTARTEWCCRVIPSSSAGNLQHLIWAKSPTFPNGAVYYFQEAALGRLRIFSWAPGEDQAIEHVEIPYHLTGRAVGKYSAGGYDRIIVIGNQSTSVHPTLSAYARKYWTITLS
ncbi:MAG: hypothetical protein IT349_19305 [Candidatus Eisenbacteria bacterium]|nr:hypothetical protein [Candidatus Eisenbacteria bacterium]